MIWPAVDVRRHGPCTAVTAGGAAVVVGTFAPWVRSGAADRSSYDVAELVERLGFAEDGPLTVALRAWPLVPLLVVAGVVAAWSGWRAVGGALALVVAVYAGTVAVAVTRAPDVGLVTVRWGPWLTAAGALVVAGGAVGLLVTPATGREPRARRAAPLGGRS